MTLASPSHFQCATPRTGVVEGPDNRALPPDPEPSVVTEKEFGKRSIKKLIEEIQYNPKKVDDINPIRIIEKGEHVYSLDHRRLIAFRRLGMEIPYIRVTRDNLNKKDRKRIDRAPHINHNGAFIHNRADETKE